WAGWSPSPAWPAPGTSTGSRRTSPGPSATTRPGWRRRSNSRSSSATSASTRWSSSPTRRTPGGTWSAPTSPGWTPRSPPSAGLGRAESQTAWAGRVLLALGLAGVLAGLLSGYATARGLSQRVARLSVRVRAVQAQLDQEVGAMTVERPGQLGDLDEQLDRVV